MTKSYSLDLRRRVARCVEAGHSCHEAARHFEVSVAFVVRLMAAYRATGSLGRQTRGRVALLQARPTSRVPAPACCREGRHHHAATCN
jgi:transposase